MQKAFFRVAGALIEFPDHLVGFASLDAIPKGWVVKKMGDTDFEGERGMMQAVEIALRTTKSIAGYKDGNLELWDVVMIFDNEDEATEAARENGQMTIYQIETATLKWLE